MIHRRLLTLMLALSFADSHVMSTEEHLDPKVNCRNPSTITCRINKTCQKYGYDFCDTSLGLCSYSECSQLEAQLVTRDDG